MTKKQFISSITSLLSTVLLPVVAIATPVQCILTGDPLPGEPIQHQQQLFHGFKFVTEQAEIERELGTFAALDPWLQTLIRQARTESMTIPLPDSGNELENIISYMDYLSIDSYLYLNSEEPITIYRADIGVGGGNGAYEYFVEMEPQPDGTPQFERIYEDFDGDLYYCAPDYRYTEFVP